MNTTINADYFDINEKELAVARCIAEGMNFIESAKVLGISWHTVKDRLRRVVKKTNTRNRTHAIAVLTRHNII